MSHAWCASKIDNQWYIFDPTWGSGYVNNGKFLMLLTIVIKANPSEIIASHMPFDYMWQFLNYPISNQEFYNGSTGVDKSKAI
jgi:transglutaminase/protease-like cytokinesis protein 3